MRIAAIDIGSNSIRLTIVDAPARGRRVTCDEEKVYARLGRGVPKTGELSVEAMDVAVVALDRMVRLAREQEATHVRAVATAAVRDARNGAAFVERVRAELGLDIEVIDGAHEGRLALLSAVDGLAVGHGLTVVDIGGGSVEVVTGSGAHVDSVVSMPLGAVVLADRFGDKDPLSKTMHRRLSRHVQDMLAEALPDIRTPAVLAGSGGTVTTLAAMIAAARDMSLAGVHGLCIGAEELGDLRSTLVRSTAGERERMKGLSQSRIDLIVPGVVVLDEVMRALGAQSITVNAHGMREGIVLEVIERERGMLPCVDRMRSVRDVGGGYRNDVRHAEHVRYLALQLFDDLVPDLGLAPDDRPLLEAAALLHDVGHHVAYEDHHKHSFHLISHADLPGFTAVEVRLIAAIARYHKGSRPKSRHDAIQGFDAGEVDRVSGLAALLRLADGLDRSRGQRVRSINVLREGDRLVLCIDGTPPFDIEIAGALRKADLAESIWDITVEVLGAGDAPRRSR
ncbi:MAG: Ppx/GppA phosphatase family protein [Coriobacteriia bacterium]|nr:Ppx/GppA phosphatase family protein [Coriobacteriia bacterium]